MPQIVNTLVSSVMLTSKYTAYTKNDGSKSTSNPNTATASYGLNYAALGIPDGSVINSAVFMVGSFGSPSPAHGTAIRGVRVNGTDVDNMIDAGVGIDIKPYLAAGENTIMLRFKSGTSNTSYPSKPPTSDPNEQTNSGALTFNNVTVTIDYTLPFSACTAPSAASLDAAVSEGNVTLSFSGAAGGTNNGITGMEVQYSESDDNASWSAWQALTVIATSSGSGSFAVAPSSTRARYRRFQLRTLGAAGASYYSGWKVVTGSVRRNSAPVAPGVTAPVASKITYNSQPRILATVGSDADGHTQTLAASGYAASSTGAQAAGKKLVLRRSSAAAAGAQSVSVSSTDALGVASSAVDRSFTYAVPSWADAALVAGETPIKAAHMAELQTAINNVRAYYGLVAYAFTAITAGVTGLAGWTGHVAELRAAIDAVVALVNGWDTANGTHDISLPAWIAISENRPAAAIIAQLRAAIPLL